MSGKDNGGKDDPLPDLGGMRTRSEEDLLREGRLPTSASRELKPDQVFAGRYRIVSKIGEGGAGFVYRALDQLTKREIALKVIRADRVATPEARAKLIEEAVIAREIRHRNVVAVFDAAEFEGQSYLTMELLSGTSLRTWMRTQLNQGIDCPIAAAVAIVTAILDGLEAAHSMGVTHRDLKPENVYLVSPPGEGGVRLKLLDFGLALPAGQQIDSKGSKGTPSYMAPEQQNAPESAKPSADLYALSKIFYELLAGVLPQDQWQPPSDGRNDVPKGVDELIRKGLSTIPRSRPQTVADYRAALIAAMDTPEARQGRLEKELRAKGPAAMSAYAESLSKGESDPVRLAAARRWFAEAAEGGDVPAMKQIAAFLERGIGGEKDEAAALRWYEKAAGRGDAFSMHCAGIAYWRGRECTQDLVKARDWFRKGAEGGYWGSMSFFADALRRGEGGPKDPAQAREWYRQSLTHGDARSAVTLGNMLEAGEGGPIDLQGARTLYVLRAEQNFEDGVAALKALDEKLAAKKPASQPAALSVSEAITHAEALQKSAIAALKSNPSAAIASWDEAGRLLKQAAQTGDARAKLAYARFLGDIQMKPHRMTDDANSRAYAKSAADDGLRDAMMRMGHDTINGVWGPRDQVAALAWFEKAGAAGDSEGWRDAGNLVFSPYDDPPNHARARDYWAKAAAMGNSAAMFQLGRLYGGDLWGQDTSAMLDKKLARKWFDAAEQAGHPKKYVDGSRKELGLD